MLHGTYSKSNIKQRYTEFMLEDLNHKLYHYWALGHIHQRQELVICRLFTIQVTFKVVTLVN